MILVIDNYDSFTYNLVQYLGELVSFLRSRGDRVACNDRITIEEIEGLARTHRAFARPLRPTRRGSSPVIRHFAGKVPAARRLSGPSGDGTGVQAGSSFAPIPDARQDQSNTHDGRTVFEGVRTRSPPPAITR